MIAKQKLKYINLLFLFSILILSGCTEDDDIFQDDLTGFIQFGFSNESIKGYSFGIDNSTYIIENTDILPYQFDVSSLTATFVAIKGTTVTVDGVEQISGVTANDFSNEITYTLTAKDGVSKRTYTVKANVSLVNPDEVQWNQLSPNAFDVDYESQEYFKLNGKHFLITGKEGKFGESKLYSSVGGENWTEETPIGDFPIGSNHNIVVRNGIAYVVGFAELKDPYGLGIPAYYQKALTFDLYTTSDGTSWNKIEEALAIPGTWGPSSIASINTSSFIVENIIYSIGGNTAVFGTLNGYKPDAVYVPAAAISSVTLKSLDDVTFDTTGIYTVDMPRRTHSASFTVDGRMYILGGLDLNGVPLSDVWSSDDGVNWTLVSEDAFSPRFKASIVTYDNKLWMFGGATSDGTCTSEILVSEDTGVTWEKAKTFQQLPDSFTARCNANIVVDHQGNILIIGGQTTSIIDGKAQYTTLTDVWSGKLNKLN
ncbi:DUF6242 domain-containing protein [Cellulophaga omnivescoria]|uniref:DUF6242 domain-containing protein n=1 Tax=Cellulophaga omnivescoria TaxID=1888890 RepID=UPI0009847BBD|nr:DUF6242 domain-containing protein [Cellulophaga omnivescoria]